MEYPPQREPLTGPELHALAAEGDTEAMLILADLTDDYATEKAWIKKAAEAGNADAIRKLGRGKELKKLKRHLKDRAETGDPDAMVSLAELLDDSDTITSWLEKAAELGHTGAMTELGRIASEEEMDDDLARSWFERAAAAGSIEAMLELATSAAQEGDADEELAWYEKAAEHGSALAMNSLGYLCAKQGDSSQARTWYEKASQSDDEALADSARAALVMLDAKTGNGDKAV